MVEMVLEQVAPQVAPPPDTVAVLVTKAGAPLAMLTCALMTGAFAPGNNTTAVVHASWLAELALQSHPDAVTGNVILTPAGMGSLTEMAPAVLLVPPLPTRMEYVPVCPTANAAGVAVLLILSWGAPLLALVVVLVLEHGSTLQLTPAGGVTVVLLTMLPVALSCAVPLMLMLML